MRRLNDHRDDGLSELLRAIDVRSTVYCVSELTAPWGFRVESSTVAKFHVVLEGACILTVAAGESLPLKAGHLALLPDGSERIMRDRPDSAVRYLDRILAEYRRE